MKTRSELKSQAKEALKGNWGWAIAVTLVPSFALMPIYTILITFLIMFIGFNPTDTTIIVVIILILIVYLAFVLALIGFNVSQSTAMLDLIRNKRHDFEDAVLYAFKEKRYFKFLWMIIIESIFLYLWFLLFIIPGIIKSFSYSQTIYVLKDDLENGQEVSVTSPITKSRELMDGHKWEYFVLQLSFLGWELLATLTLGIGYIWLVPYIYATDAAYYQSLIENDLDDVTEASTQSIEVEKEDELSIESPQISPEDQPLINESLID